MAKAYGKIILAGEHSVVYGHPAIACPISLEIEANITLAKEPRLYFNSNVFLADSSEFLFKKVTLKLSELFGYDVNLFGFDILSSIPNRYGLGSSAALSVALIRSVIDFLNLPKMSNYILAMAMEMEKIFHGNPSGIDHTTISEEKFIWFKDGMFEKIHCFTELEIIIVMSSSSHRRTIESVTLMKKLLKEQSSYVKNIFQSIENLVSEMRKAIENGDLSLIGSLMNKNHDLLKSLGISNLELDNMCALAINNGAHGAKLTGAGRGGCIIVLAGSHTKKIKCIFESHGYNAIICKIS